MSAGAEFLTTVNALPEPMLLVDVGGTICAANAAAARCLRVPLAALAGHELGRFVADAPDVLADYLCRCARTSQFLPGAMTLRFPDGASAKHRAFAVRFDLPRRAGARPWVLIRLERAHASTSAFVALNEKISELDREITRRRRIEVELRRSEQALRDADRKKDEFLATLAHELRNPLAPIRNGIRLMAACADDAAKIAVQRAMIERQIEHMVRLIDDLMDVSRITQGRLELHPEPIDLDAVLQIAGETCRPLLESKRQVLRLERAPGPLPVLGDVTRLAQVFSNLLDNSAKYSPPGSLIRVVSRLEDNVAAVSVSDQGIGIPAAMLERVFDMFAQLPSHAREGLGVGLALVKRIVELHRGTVDVSSAGEGQGSTFIVRLPVSGPTSEVTAARTVPEARGMPRDVPFRARVLVADDNADSAQTLALVLELEGHEVRVAGDGLEALEIAEQFLPHAVLLDIGMPRLDGYQTARRIRERSWGRGVCLIAVTGWSQQEDRDNAMHAGFDRHLVKPVDPYLLPRRLEQWLRHGTS